MNSCSNFNFFILSSLLVLGSYGFPLSVFGQTGRHETANVSYKFVRRLVPGPNLPERVKVQKAVNNVDLTLYKGRYYLAFRTAPTHFASPKVRLYIVSSADMEHWDYEWEVHLGSDMREPRFLQMNGKLMFYFFQGGEGMFTFHPRHVYGVEKVDTGWSMRLLPGMDGFVPWRFHTYKGKALLSAYYGVGLYQKGHQGNLRLFASNDGWDWKPISECPQSSRPGAEEGEFNFDNQGDLWGTIRYEGGGGAIVHATADNLSTWHAFNTKFKYDSALLLNHQGRLYLVARRNLDGAADRKYEKNKDHPERNRLNNMLRYSLTRKSTAIYQMDTAKKEMIHLLDLPSTGDNSFAGVAPRPDGTYWLVNYSSDFTKRPKNWIRGQLGKTYLYLFELDLGR
jgi:hypothetical protein